MSPTGTYTPFPSTSSVDADENDWWLRREISLIQKGVTPRVEARVGRRQDQRLVAGEPQLAPGSRSGRSGAGGAGVAPPRRGGAQRRYASGLSAARRASAARSARGSSSARVAGRWRLSSSRTQSASSRAETKSSSASR
jgi:hypothetical protein